MAEKGTQSVRKRCLCAAPAFQFMTCLYFCVDFGNERRLFRRAHNGRSERETARAELGEHYVLARVTIAGEVCLRASAEQSRHRNSIHTNRTRFQYIFV